MEYISFPNQHKSNVGSNLNSAIVNHNKVVGSLETRFVPQVKKLKEMVGTLMNKEIPGIEKIETARRSLTENNIKRKWIGLTFLFIDKMGFL